VLLLVVMVLLLVMLMLMLMMLLCNMRSAIGRGTRGSSDACIHVADAVVVVVAASARSFVGLCGAIGLRALGTRRSLGLALLLQPKSISTQWR